MKTKKIIIISIIVLLVLFIGFLVITKFIDWNPKKTAENKLNDLADTFYDHYYDGKLDELGSAEEVAKFLAEYKDLGLTITLEDLQYYLDNFKIEDYSAFKKCNKSGTKVTVIPIEPYGKKDYSKTFTLNCDF